MGKFILICALIPALILSGCGTTESAGEQYPGVPEKVQVTLTDTGIVLAWEAAQGAEGYVVYRSLGGSDAFAWLGATSGTEYCDDTVEANTEYTYMVAGSNVAGQGPFSSIVAAEVNDLIGDVADSGEVGDNEPTPPDGGGNGVVPGEGESDSGDPGISPGQTGEKDDNSSQDSAEKDSSPEELEPPNTAEVFKGYFQNPSYSNPAVFLYSGPQTAMSSDLERLAVGINDKKDFSTLAQIYEAVASIPSSETGDKFSLTADEITRRGLTGCTDYGLVFAALARHKGIPTVFLQTARIDWVEDLQAGNSMAGMIRGHILVETYIDGEWYLVDSTAGRLYLDYDKNNPSLDDGYYVFAKSIEVWDAGIEDEMHNREVMQDQFRNFDVDKYQQPLYSFLDLRDLSIPANKAHVFNPEQSYINRDLIIIGDQEPCEAFMARYSGIGSGMSPEVFNDKVSSDSLDKVDILFFYTLGQWVPPLLEREFEEELGACSEGSVVVRHNPEGKKRIFMAIGSNLQETLEMIDGLPAEYEEIGE